MLSCSAQAPQLNSSSAQIFKALWAILTFLAFFWGKQAEILVPDHMSLEMHKCLLEDNSNQGGSLAVSVKRLWGADAQT